MCLYMTQPMLCMQPVQHKQQAMELFVCYFSFQVAFQNCAFATFPLSTIRAALGWASLECPRTEKNVSRHLYSRKRFFEYNLPTAVNTFLVCYDLLGNPTTLAALVTQCALSRLLQLVLCLIYAINLITHKHTKYTVTTT